MTVQPREPLDLADAFLTEPLRQPTMPSLDPGRHIAALMGTPADDLPYPTVTVVGSKGKGTATIACSAALFERGLTVGTVTSPSLTDVRERVRVDGAPVPAHAYVETVDRLRACYDQVRGAQPDWVLPGLGGRPLLAALSLFRDARVDVAVTEASMGGAGDLTRILRSEVVVVTEVFGEHLGSLGNTVPEIGVEKLGAVTDRTKVVVTVDQREDVWEAWRRTGLLRGVDLVVVGRSPKGHHPNPLTDRNIELGRRAAAELLRLKGSLEDPVIPGSMRLPGRCQSVGPGGMVDCAVSEAGADAAMDQYRVQYGRDPEVVLVMAPRSKDDTGVRAALDRRGVRYVAVDMPELREALRPDATVWAELTEFSSLDWSRLPSSWLAFGTVSFAAAVLRGHGADTARLW